VLQEDSAAHGILFRHPQAVPAVRIGNDHDLIGRDLGSGGGEMSCEDQRKFEPMTINAIGTRMTHPLRDM